MNKRAELKAAKDALFPEFKDGVTPGRVLYGLTGIAPMMQAGRGIRIALQNVALLHHMLGLIKQQKSAGWHSESGVWAPALWALACLLAADVSHYYDRPWLVFASFLMAAQFLMYNVKALYVRYRRSTKQPLRFWGWVRSPSLWGLTIALAILMMSGGHAEAQNVTIQTLQTAINSTASSSNQALLWIHALVPDTTTATPLTTVLNVINACAMFLCVCMIAYWGLSGQVALSAGGLEKNGWHVFYAPLRVCFAMALVTPVFPDGLNLAEHTFIAAATSASRVGDLGESDFNSSIASGLNVNPTLASMQQAIPGATVLHNILDMETCAAGVNLDTYFQRGITLPAAAGTQSEDGTQTVWDYAQCGSVSIDNAGSGANSETTTYIAARKAAISAVITGIRNGGLPAQLTKDYMTQSGNMDNWPANLYSQVSSLGTAYDTAMQSAAQAFIQSKYSNLAASVTGSSSDTSSSTASDTFQSIADCGWMCSGMLYLDLSAINAELDGLEEELPEFNSRHLNADVARQEIEMLSDMDKQWQAETSADDISGTVLANPQDSSSMLTKLLAPVMKPAAQTFVASTTNTSSTNFLQSVIDTGHIIIDGSYAAVIVDIATGALTGNALGSMTGLHGAFQAAQPYVFMALVPLFIIGITQAYVLPMMPYVQFLFAAITWIILVGEGLCGVTMLAVLFTHPKGEEFISQVQKGAVMLAVSACCYPILIVLGYALFVTLVNPVGNFVNSTFAATGIAITGGHLAGPITILTLLGIRCAITQQIFSRLCSLITMGPHRMLEYLATGNAAALGATQAAEATTGGIAQGAQAAMGGYVGAREGALNKAMGKQGPGAAVKGNGNTASDGGAEDEGGQGGSGGSVAPRVDVGGGDRMRE